MPSFSWRVWPALVLLLLPSPVAAEEASLLEGWHDVWLFRFLVNVLGYSTIIIPGYFLISYFKRTNYLETGSGICFPLIKTCVFGSEAKTGLLDDVSVTPRNEADSGLSVKQVVKLIFCAAGLQVGILLKVHSLNTYHYIWSNPYNTMQLVFCLP
ncbi:adenosine 3'-phospho 5'-phosphosulfate transporter 1-like [Notothenia coriiceps]|uniref:Adenosine 3'-phospho 5'-phosphosulfate transporter 1-like n=1 Tax=Notothenia coriiceps TaxID=8208 RepID=A0A6I9NE22_9TELE|nr:PREDICTED: adenosine 3'-phospho 5'-phosphosulfate transporter 1-like [Notothenia coriiceps]